MVKVKKINKTDLTVYDNVSGVSRQELLSHGCMNCVWKMHNMCPSGLSGKGFLDAGICEEFVNFLLSLFKEGDSINVLWENYNLYVLRLQSLEDYKSFKEMQSELAKLESEGASQARLDNLESKRNTYKLWWSKLNDTVLRSLGRIVDREKRSVSDSTSRMSVQQLNILINENTDKLLRYEDGEKEKKGI